MAIELSKHGEDGFVSTAEISMGDRVFSCIAAIHLLKPTDDQFFAEIAGPLHAMLSSYERNDRLMDASKKTVS